MGPKAEKIFNKLYRSTKKGISKEPKTSPKPADSRTNEECVEDLIDSLKVCVAEAADITTLTSKHRTIIMTQLDKLLGI